MGGYEYFTDKQAGILYGAIKRGELLADDQTIRDMYSIVGMQLGWMGFDERRLYGKFSDALDHYLAGRIDIAQACLDGVPVHKEQVQVGTAWEEPNIFDALDDGLDPDALVEVPVYETRWVIGGVLDEYEVEAVDGPRRASAIATGSCAGDALESLIRGGLSGVGGLDAELCVSMQTIYCYGGIDDNAVALRVAVDDFDPFGVWEVYDIVGDSMRLRAVI